MKNVYDVAISVYDVTNKILSNYSNNIVNVVMWPKFGNSSTSMREVSWPQLYKYFSWKNTFFAEWSWFNFNNLGLALGTAFKVYTSVAKGLQLKVRKFLGLIPTFVEVTGEKLVGGPFYPLILNRVKILIWSPSVSSMTHDLHWVYITLVDCRSKFVFCILSITSDLTQI